jgi:hypothetical protein
MLYEQSATVLSSLYVCPVQNALGRVPLIPCYLNGNNSNSIPYKYRGAIPAEAAADSRPNSGTGSKLFEINIWMWHYGRTFPRNVSVAVWLSRLPCGSGEFRNPGNGRLRP